MMGLPTALVRVALWCAACLGSKTAVTALLATGALVDEHVPPDLTGSSSRIALMMAAEVGAVDVVALLLAAGASVSAQTDSKDNPLSFGCTSLFQACTRVSEHAAVPIIEELLRGGADVRHQSKGPKSIPRTALHPAALLDRSTLIPQLVKAWG